MHARVDRHVAVLDGPAEDHPQRHERVPDRRRVAALGEQVVGDALDVAMLHVSEARSADSRDDVVAKRGFVASDRARLVRVARAGADAARLHPGDELLRCLGDRRVRRRAQRSSPDAGLRLGAPRARFGQRGERLPDALRLARAPHARLVGRVAVAARAAPRRARLLVPNLDACPLRHNEDATQAVGRSARQSRDSPRTRLAISAVEAVRRGRVRKKERIPAN